MASAADNQHVLTDSGWLQHQCQVMDKQRIMALTSQQVQELSPTALAYLGDAVYELYVRGLFLTPPKRIQAYHRQVVSLVRAEQQAAHIEQLTPLLTAAEKDILRRGRNASGRGPRRIDGPTYQQATGFETLVGYLYLTDPDRLADLLSQIPTLSPASIKDGGES